MNWWFPCVDMLLQFILACGDFVYSGFEFIALPVTIGFRYFLPGALS